MNFTLGIWLLYPSSAVIQEQILVPLCDSQSFALQDGQVEAPEERPKKTKAFLVHAVENWDAEFYAKVNDDIYVNIGM